MTVDAAFVTRLGEILGDSGVLGGPEMTAKYRQDWTGRFSARDAVVARPADTAQLTAVVELCVEHGVAIVPQGGNTGLVGGSVPLAGELVISTERLAGVESVDAATGILTAGAGTSLADVQRVASEVGWRYGVDIASRDSATIGGNVATNAGGLRVLRYGATRAQLSGVAFVDGTGAFHGLHRSTMRDNTGYHLPGLLCGSEGTLGIITAVRVRLVPDYPCRTTALLRFATERDAAVAVESLRGVLPSVESAEIFFTPGLELVCQVFSWSPPFSTTSGGYVLVEVADTDDPTATLGEVVEALHGVADAAVAQDATGRERLWRYRERHTEAISTVGHPHKLDVAVPPGCLAEFIERAPTAVAAVDTSARVWLFGHGGEASIHVNVTGPAEDDDRVDDAVLGLVVDMGGSISAEHGVGTAKLAWIGRTTDVGERRLRASLKAAFDPNGIMNPNVLVAPV